MFLIEPKTYWTAVINMIVEVLVQNYLLDPFTICLVWNKDFDLELELPDNGKLNQFVIIELESLSESLRNDVFDFEATEKFLKRSELVYDDLSMKLIAAIDSTYCEAFIAFQDDIPEFLRAYQNSSLMPDRSSMRNQFIFGYSKDLQGKGRHYFDDTLFLDQARVLIIETENVNSTIFSFKTNRFVGTLDTHPEELYEINRYDALESRFLDPNVDLFPNKMKNFQGRVVTAGVFDYRPFVAIDYERKPNSRDHSKRNPTGQVLLDGTEVRIIKTYCEVYNCSLEADTSEDDWGYIYSNMTGYGVRLMLTTRRAEMCLDASYYWITPFIDKTHYIGFSRNTLLVPKPKANIVWNLPLRPFQFTLWLGVSIYLLVETISLLFTREMEQTMERSGVHSWLESVTYGYSTTLKLFVSQSSGYIVNSGSLRTLLFACYMNDIIITSIYSGGLASILTLPILAEAPDTIDRVIKFQLPWAATSSVWIEPYSTIDAGSREEKIVKLYRVNTLDELTDMSLYGFYGFIVERMMDDHFANIEWLTPHAMNRLKLMLENLFTEYTTCLVPRGWAMRDHFNSFILNWHAGGFGEYWEWKTAADFTDQNLQGRIRSSKHAVDNDGPEKLDMLHVAGILLILVVGLLLSAIVFFLEILNEKYNLEHLLHTNVRMVLACGFLKNLYHRNRKE